MMCKLVKRNTAAPALSKSVLSPVPLRSVSFGFLSLGSETARLSAGLNFSAAARLIH